TQSMMWKQFTEDGILKYQFMETVLTIKPMYMLRALGGSLFIAGLILMIVNLYKTIINGQLIENEKAQAAPLPKAIPTPEKKHWHNWMERRPVQMAIFSLIAVGIGGIIEMVPTFLVK